MKPLALFLTFFLMGLPVQAASLSPILTQTKNAERMIQQKSYKSAQQLISQQIKTYPKHILKPYWVYLLASLPMHSQLPSHVKRDGFLPHYYWWQALHTPITSCPHGFGKFAKMAHQSPVKPVIGESTVIQKRLGCLVHLPEKERVVLAKLMAQHQFFWLVPRLLSSVKSPEGLFLKGEALFKQGRYHASAKNHVRFLEQTTKQARWANKRKEAVLQLGISQRKLRKYKAAHEWWQWISSQDRVFYPEVLWEKAMLASEQKQIGQARQHLEKIYQGYPKHPKAPEALWYLIQKKMSPSQTATLALAKKFTQRYPNDTHAPAVRFWYAQTLEEQGHKTQANRVFKTITQGPRNDFYTHIAKCHIENKDCFRPVYKKLKQTPPYLTFVDRNPPLSELVETQQNHILKVIAPFLELSPLDKEMISSYAYLKNGNYFRSIRNIWRKKTSDKQFLRLMYPLHYPQILKKNAQRFGLPWGLVAGLAWQESMYKADIRSPAGAIGLMQLMPATAKGVARQLNKKGYRTHHLTRPEVNVEMGSYYLKQQLKRWDGDLIPTIASYNAGPNAVARWIKKYNYKDNLDFIENTPYSETRRYVKQVLTHYWVYNEVYGS